MLTKNDLQQIRGVVREEAGTLDKKFGAKFDKLDKKIDGVESSLSTKINKLDQKLDKVQEDISVYLNKLEPRVTAVEIRVNDIEEHLDLPKPQ